MKRAIFSDSVVLDGVAFPLNSGQGKFGYFREILTAIHGQLNAMLSHHGKILMVRVDLHTERHSRDNLELSRFLEKVKRHCQEQYKAKRMGYVWVREQERAKQQHYHLALILDANRVQHPARLLHWIGERWESRGHPKPWVPENCFTIVSRQNSEAFGEVFKRLSYLAKERTKGYRESTVNDYSTSRIKPKSSEIPAIGDPEKT